MLGQPVDELSPQDACLVEFAQSLTARPWTIRPADLRRLSAAGLSRESIVLAIGLVAMFNYFTRVADGTGIEADYGTELPGFVYRGVTESARRPEPAEWPAVDDSVELLALLTGVDATWRRWRDYVLDSPAPLPRTTRRELRLIAARNACDGAIALPDADAETPARNLPAALSEFAEKLSRTPWLMAASDVEALRSTGMDDLSILHVISVVAYQSAESRLRIGLSALARSGD
ncbi:MAG TPA: hypothetical protein VFU36_12245 [Jatrophihabitans sp.]|nr:hypothetical protein [Jatrophihabitans sp.]